MSYPEIVRRAFQLWWRTRALWPLGVLAALFGAGDYRTGNFNFNYSVSADELPGGGAAADLLERLEASEFVRAIIANPLPFIIGAAVILIGWALIAALVGQLAHGAMIRMADVADQGYAASLGDALRVGASRLLPLFLLAILAALPILLLLGVIIAVVAAVVAQVVAAGTAGPESVLPAIGGVLLCVLPLALIAIVLGILLSLLVRIAQRVCVIEGRGPLQSLGRAWRLLWRNLGLTLLNWLALAILGALFGAAATLPALAIALPAFFSFFSSGAIPWAALIALLIYGLVITVLLGGVLTSFNSTLWTLLYRSFLAREPDAAVPESYAPGD
jgi:hypothetical protein